MYDVAKGGLAATGAGVVVVGGHAISSAVTLAGLAAALIIGGLALVRASGKRNPTQ